MITIEQVIGHAFKMRHERGPMGRDYVRSLIMILRIQRERKGA